MATIEILDALIPEGYRAEYSHAVKDGRDLQIHLRLIPQTQDGPKCPHCGHIHNDPDFYADMVTYWGESEEVEAECELCEETFFVREEVTRVWESTTISRSAKQP